MNPTELFDTAVRALRREDWRAAAATCDDVSLRAFKRQQLEHVAPRATFTALTAEMILAHQPDMPREVAEYQVAQHRRYEDPTDRLGREFPSVSSVEAMRAMEPVDVFAAWLEGRSPRRQLEHFVRVGHPGTDTIDAATSMGEYLYNYLTLGVVHDGPDIAHVVFRPQVDDTQAWDGEIAEQMNALPPDEQQLERENWRSGILRFARCRRTPDGSWHLYAAFDFLAVGSVNIGGIAPRSETDGISNSTL